MTKKVLRKGFVDGFVAPFSFFTLRMPAPVERYYTSVDSAWEDVGDAFYQAMKDEGQHFRGVERSTKKLKHKVGSHKAA
jgi:hypothetical protein